MIFSEPISLAAEAGGTSVRNSRKKFTPMIFTNRPIKLQDCHQHGENAELFLVEAILLHPQ